MKFTGLSHHHSHGDSPIHRLPAWLKLGLAVAIIGGTVVVPWVWTGWFLAVLLVLAVAIGLSRVPVSFLLKRLLVLSPFVLGVALVNLFEPLERARWLAVTAKSVLCLLTVLVLSNTTPFSQQLRVLRAVHVPSLLVTTVALMHRYLFVLLDEAERMRRARLSRTFSRQRRLGWRSLGTVVGQLFVRASERAERIYDAMCARGWR